MAHLEPTARALGCTRELAGILDILADGAGYQRMRAAVEADGVGGAESPDDLRGAVRAMLVPPGG